MTRRTLALNRLKLGILASRPRFQQLVPDSVPCADLVLRAHPSQEPADKLRFRASSQNSPKCQQSRVMCSHEVLQCANNALVPKHLFVQLELVERVADIIESAFVPYRSCHARPVPPRSFLWKLVHNSAFAQLPYQTWANRSSPHRQLVISHLKT